jgi:alpha-D-xyloside xylohydrolase
MNNTTVRDNTIVFSRNNELVRITPCHKNAVRFEAFPDCKEFDEDYTLMPEKAECVIEDMDYCVFMTIGKLKIQLERNGKLTFYNDGKVILEEKEELAFHDGYRNYERKNGSWSARITFKSNEGEHFYGLGHDACNRFDLKGCSFDIGHVNAKCTIPFVYSSLGYGFL